MKFKRSLLSFIFLFTLLSAWADTNSIPPLTTADFFNQLPGYLTSFDTTSTVLVGSKLEISTSMLYNNGLNFADNLEARINFASIKSTPQANFNTGFATVNMRYAGIGGIISGGAASIGYSHVKYNVRLSGSIEVGYDKQANFNHGSGYVEPLLHIEKAANNIVPGFAIGYPVNFRGRQPVYPDVRITMDIPF